MSEFPTHSRSPSIASLKSPSRQVLDPVPDLPSSPPSAHRHRDYFVVDPDEPHFRPDLHRKLPFHYHGDVFAQHGEYTDAGLYMSRLPPSRKEKQPLTALAGVGHYKHHHQVKLAPVTPTKSAALQQQSERESGTSMLTNGVDPSPSKQGKSKSSSRKRQYAVAVETMAANHSLHGALLSDNVVPSVMALCRSKDVSTLSACVATLCHLSCEPEGRAVLLTHNALPLLAALALSSAHTHEKLLLPNCLYTLANLTIEDGSESVFIKEKALDCLVKQRRSSALAERACTFAIFNLSCPEYAYPRVDDAVHALAEHGKDARDRETLSRALYNLACTRMNHVKLVEPEAASLLRLLISYQQCEAARLNALGAFWYLVESGAGRRALVKSGDCIRVLVEELPRLGLTARREEYVICALTTLIQLTHEVNAREVMGNAGALHALAALGTTNNRHPDAMLRIYRLLAILLSAPANIQAVDESVLQFLLAFRHEFTEPRANASTAAMSRYVLFALASILSWNDPEDSSDMTEQTHKPATHAPAKPLSPPELGELLDEPRLLARIYQHVAYPEFLSDSAQVRLQMVLLYNMSFRYPKADVARLAVDRLSHVGTTAKDRHTLMLLGGSFFSLCMEYEVHHLLLAAAYAATGEGDFLLQRLVRNGDTGAQSMCLNAVCILFDGRSFGRGELLQFIDRTYPVVVGICTRKWELNKGEDDANYCISHVALQAACAACLTRFASVAEYRLVMVENGLMDALTVLASSEDDETLRLCVHTYALLSQDKAVGGLLLRGGVVKSLTRLAAAPEEAVRRACAVTLCNLSTDVSNVESLAHLGALRALLILSYVKSNDPETRRVCLKAVSNLLRVVNTETMRRLCDDGLIWAFGIYTDAMEPRDHAILSDAFCVLALHASSRTAIMTKPATIASLLQILDSSAPCSTKVTVLKGLLNLLADHTSAALFLKIGVVPALIKLLDTEEKEAEVCGVVAELVVLIFQNTPVESDAAAAAYAELATMRALTQLVHFAGLEEQEGKKHRGEGASCGQSCAVLLHLLSLNNLTRPALLTTHAPLQSALPALLQQTKGDTQALLLRCLYNLTCDSKLLAHIPMRLVIPALKAALAPHEGDKCQEEKGGVKQNDGSMTAALCAGILRNTSTASECYEDLSSEAATKFMCELFAAGTTRCREDVAVTTCNLFLGRVNSHLLLSRGVLPLVLSLCAPGSICASEAHGMCSAVLRKVAIAPGNAQLLVRGDAVRHLVLLMNETSTLFVKTNCVATFCLIAQKPSMLTVLAAHGVIASVLEFLEHVEQSSSTEDSGVESMCVDLLSKLARFSNADDPRERRLSSLLYRVVEKDDPTMPPPLAKAMETSSSECWQTDRSFLDRVVGGELPPTSIASSLMMTRSMAPVVTHAPRSISYAGYAIEVAHVASYIEMGTIEPMLPPVDALEDEASAVQLDIVEFTPPPVFPKTRTPFTPLPISSPASKLPGAIASPIKSTMGTKPLGLRVVPPLPPRQSTSSEDGSRASTPSSK